VVFDIGGVVAVWKHRNLEHVFKVFDFVVRRTKKIMGIHTQDSRLISEFYKRIVVLDADVIKTIQDLNLAGLKTPVISNTSAEGMRLNEEVGIYEHFGPLILSCDVGIEKPDRKIYEIAVERIGLKPEECIFVDDKVDNLATAAIMGMKTILFKDAEQLRKDLEKYNVNIG
jgi:epoxide hydrolase-like predicted phosphatase